MELYRTFRIFMVFLLMAHHNYNGRLVASRLRFVQCLVSFDPVSCSECVACCHSGHCAPGKKATVPIYKVLVRVELSTYQHRSGFRIVCLIW